MHQPASGVATPALVPPRQRPERMGNELRQLTPEPLHFPPASQHADAHQTRSLDVRESSWGLL